MYSEKLLANRDVGLLFIKLRKRSFVPNKNSTWSHLISFSYTLMAPH
jgi:hypothetical protein